MPYPVQISAAGIHSIAPSATGAPTIDISYGPYRLDDDLYCFLVEEISASAAKAHVFKSTDEGLSWAKQDAGNAPSLRAGSPSIVDPVALSCVPFFDLTVIPKIYCMFVDTSGDLRVGTFNLVQDQWKALSASGPSDYDPTQRDDRFAMAARPTGINGIEFPIVYLGPKDTVSATDYNRVWYTAYRPSTDDWLTPVRLFGVAGEAAHYDVAGAAHKFRTGVGGTGRVHFFATKGTGFQNPIWHRSVESNDTLNTKGQVTTKFVNPGRPTLESDELVIPFQDGGDDKLYVVRANETANPIWAEESLQDLQHFINFFGATRIPGSPDTLRVYYGDFPGPAFDEGLFYKEWTSDTQSWGAETAAHVGDPPIDDPIEAMSTEWHQGTDGTTYFGVIFNMGPTGFRPARYTQQEGPPILPDVEINNGIFEAPGGYVVA